jgi:hypothetical protein
MNLRVNIIIICTMLAVTFTACQPGFIVTETSENLKDQKESLKGCEIIYFEPDISMYVIKKDIGEKFIDSKGVRDKVIASIGKYSKINKIKTQVLSVEEMKENSEVFINSLIKLKNNIDFANVSQDNPLNKSNSFSPVQKRIFVYSPKISPEFSFLSDKFKTPYFGIVGIFAVKSHPETKEARAFVRTHKALGYGDYFYFYNIIANVETSEIVYREIKKIPVPYQKIHALDLAIYDSFSELNKSLNK